MKTTMFLAAILLGGTAASAQTATTQNMTGQTGTAQTTTAVPPGDGITRLGNDPEGQPCTPAGFNAGLAVYPACSAMGGPVPGLADYPPCSAEVKDRCTQTYTRWTER